MKRYEVQERKPWGWVSAGNFPARTKAEGLKWMRQCAEPFQMSENTNTYRLVELVPREIERIRGKRRTAKEAQ